eukprot:CAMPEP_0116991684 /NCGR_PEP_ID=MMETSP0467-20121206/66299_1 /TAXON_ID=283647 /ORGANISM="Mesodinium pulex, Strain SPMC105" /LENGTH=84 /DNA_ID=CAMNT_0004688843 /DNA_START=702 /DNA_END=956 /DNA_ORIENTATION=+
MNVSDKINRNTGMTSNNNNGNGNDSMDKNSIKTFKSKQNIKDYKDEPFTVKKDESLKNSTNLKGKKQEEDLRPSSQRSKKSPLN